MKIKDEKLRADRLVFYEKDIQRLDAELDSFLELSNARCAMLIDADGHLVTRRGEPIESSEESIAALVAGSFAATREMARLFGEENFNVMFHQGARDSIQMQLVHTRTLLATVFDDRTNLGLVRFYAQEITKRIHQVLEAVGAQEREATLSEDFSSSAQEALDKLF